MSELEAQVGSILEIMVNTTVTEMTKVTGENTQGCSEDKVSEADSVVVVSAEAIHTDNSYNTSLWSSRFEIASEASVSRISSYFSASLRDQISVRRSYSFAKKMCVGNECEDVKKQENYLTLNVLCFSITYLTLPHLFKLKYRQKSTLLT